MAGIGDFVNTLLHRKSGQLSGQSPLSHEQQPTYAAVYGRTRKNAVARLLKILPAPLDSDIYAEMPIITAERQNNEKWSATTSYTLRDDARLHQPESLASRVAQPSYQQGDLAPVVTQASAEAPRTPITSPARAVAARGTGYTPSPLEESLRNSPLNRQNQR